MSTAISTDTLWVVLDSAGTVVLICSGADAAEAADAWRERGYQITTLDAVEVSAA